METTLAMWKRTTDRPLRTLTVMTEIAASTMKITEDGRRLCIAIHPGMEWEMTQWSHLVEGEEELDKETEEDHSHHRLEEMETNLVVT